MSPNLFWRALALVLAASVVPRVPAVRTEPVRDLSHRQALEQALQLAYWDLFDEAASLEIPVSGLDRKRAEIEEDEKRCVKTFKKRAKSLSKDLDHLEDELRARTGKLSNDQRHNLHCAIQNRRLEIDQAASLAEHVVPIAYDNMRAKIDVIQLWPAAQRAIRRDKQSGAHINRRWGDVADIGFREIEPSQEKDVKRGRDAIDEMKQLGMLPKESEDEKLASYVNEVAMKVGRASDLRVPLKVTVLETPEINAFALPGGYLYVHRGLVEATEDESQLAGVLAHEIAHVTARHGHRLMKKATIASILYQAAQVGAIIFTGGSVGLGAYYALQYGFYGLGLALSLDLLGVSREYELEADQLGVQYAWNAGYDPSGFIRFFDKMAHEEGYIRGASWFRTHPPFYARMVETRREIEFLPVKEMLVYQTPEFLALQQHLEDCAREQPGDESEPCKPSLFGPTEKDCPEPNLLEYEPGDPVEAICAVR